VGFGEQVPVVPEGRPVTAVGTSAGGASAITGSTWMVSVVRCDCGSVPAVEAGTAALAVSTAVTVPALVAPVITAFALLQFNCCVPTDVGQAMGAGKPVPVIVMGAKP
jgi:hypothetical protein